jgi:hypothetical protein
VREDTQRQREYEHEHQLKQQQAGREDLQSQRQHGREDQQKQQQVLREDLQQRNTNYEHFGTGSSNSQQNLHDSASQRNGQSNREYASTSNLSGSKNALYEERIGAFRGSRQEPESVPLHLIAPLGSPHFVEPGNVSSPAHLPSANHIPSRGNAGSGGTNASVGETINSSGSLFSTVNVLPPQFHERPPILPPLAGLRYLHFREAFSPPVLSPRISVIQQADLALAERNLQQNLLFVSASQIPADFAAMKLVQSTHYFNNYNTTIAGQSITINPTNSYVKPAPRNQWPPGYQQSSDFGVGNGFLLGSLFANLNWLLWGWPTAYGAQPNSFIYAEGYFPTPWIYVTWANRWRVHGQPGYAPEGPPADYTMPISVEVVESLRVMSGGGAIPKKTNQLFLYNAFYYPAYGRWGYKNRTGTFVWLNPQRVNVGSPIMGL